MSSKSSEIEVLVEDMIESIIQDFFEDSFSTEQEWRYAYDYLASKLQETSFEEFAKDKFE